MDAHTHLRSLAQNTFSAKLPGTKTPLASPSVRGTSNRRTPGHADPCPGRTPFQTPQIPRRSTSGGGRELHNVNMQAGSTPPAWHLRTPKNMASTEPQPVPHIYICIYIYICPSGNSMAVIKRLSRRAGSTCGTTPFRPAAWPRQRGPPGAAIGTVHRPGRVMHPTYRR